MISIYGTVCVTGAVISIYGTMWVTGAVISIYGTVCVTGAVISIWYHVGDRSCDKYMVPCGLLEL